MGCWKKIVILYKRIPFIYYILIIPIIVYMVFSITSNLNLGVRHLMPIYPFIFILVAGAVTKIKFKQAFRNYVYVICLVLIMAIYVVTAFITWPHYLSYFSELIGGAKNGNQYLMDSNLDWGQDLKNLKYYVNEHEEIDELYCMVSGWSGPAYYDIPCLNLPTNEQIDNYPDLSGYIAISISYLQREDKIYSWLWEYQPIDQIGYTIYIYNIK